MKPKHFWTLFAIAAALRLFLIGLPGYWYDESFTVLIARLPLRDLFVALSGDTHPPLYYLIIWGLLHIHGTANMIAVSMWEAYVRFPSLVFSLWSLYTFWKICEGWNLPPRAIYLAVGFMSLAPFQIHYAQEARMYSLFQLETLLAIRAIQKREWGGLGIVNLAMLYTHNYALFTLPGLFVVAWLELRRVYGPKMLLTLYERDVQIDIIKKILPPFVLPGLLFLPWFLILRFQMQQITGHYWITPVTGGEVVDMLVKLLYGFSQPDQFKSIMAMTGVGFFAYVVIRFVQLRPARWVQWLVLLFLPFTLALIVGWVWQPVLLFRGLIVSVPAFYLIGALMVSRLDRVKSLYLAVLVIPLLCGNVLDYYLYTVARKGEMKHDIAAAIEQWYEPGMTLLHVNDGSFPGWQVYAPDIPQYRFPDCELKPLGSLTQRTIDGLGWEYRTPEAAAPALIIWAEGPMSPACERAGVEPYLQDSKELIIYREDEIFFVGIWQYMDFYGLTR